MPRINSSSELEKLRKGILANRDPQKPCITLCAGSACHATGSGDVAASIEAEIEKQGLSAAVDVRKTGCHGFCERGPIIVNHPEESCYFQIKPEDAPEIVSQAVKDKIIERNPFKDVNSLKGEEVFTYYPDSFILTNYRLYQFDTKTRKLFIFPLYMIETFEAKSNRLKVKATSGKFDIRGKVPRQDHLVTVWQQRAWST